ncbi:hypothetical protein C7378_3218 [Acidipila rosea]|uniref:Glycosyl transferase family 2 n=1 Tax=Acidipila rosea TaxID=768535 RepID=A0A4R1L3Q2_9BACT|nr:hypothetical protein C7378_3218 [Acidipila rosea]
MTPLELSSSSPMQERDFIANVPVFINVRDRLGCLLRLLAWLEQAGHRNITLIDNASSYPPLISFLQSTNHRVIRLKKNAGHTSLWQMSELKETLARSWFIYTDPDVVPIEPCPLNMAWSLFELLRAFPAYIKAGPALHLDDLPAHYHLREQVIALENSLYGREILPGVFQADIDTTFALYRPHSPYTLGPAMRVRGDCELRHLPWYVDSSNVDEEERYYREHASQNVTNWNTGGDVKLNHAPVPGGLAARMESDPTGLLNDLRGSKTGKTALAIRAIRHAIRGNFSPLISSTASPTETQNAIMNFLLSDEWRMSFNLLAPMRKLRAALS